MTCSYVIVLDQGTHSTRAMIYNRLGESIFKSQREVDLFYRNSSHIEQDGKQILASCNTVLADAHKYINENELKEVSVALTTQRSTVLAWDANTGEAITPALSWLDTRAQEKLDNSKLNNQVIKEKTGLPLSAHYGASKIQWLLQHDKNVQQAKRQERLKIGPLAAYLIFNLVEQQPCYVDYSNAHRTLLWNLECLAWDADLLKAFCIDDKYLPMPVPNAFNYGQLKGNGYPLVLVNGDQNSAIYGYGKLAKQTTVINMGTGAFVLAKSKRRPILNTKLLASITYSTDGEQEYALEGTVNGAGSAMRWAENEWDVSDIETIAWKSVKDVPIFLNSIGGLGSPYWQTEIMPRFIDVNKDSKDYTNEQCMAALMESIVFLLTINIEEIHKHEIKTKHILVAGGMSQDEYLCQCLANLCGVSVVVSKFKEATSRGAAWLVMQRPEWGVLGSKQLDPLKDYSLQARFEKFKSSMEDLM
ncbi:MAG: FGGY family carbohydrate kinase [Gammaproteobacteria bacterium]